MSVGSGLAISLFSEDEYKQLQSIERVIGRKFEREIVPGFEPSVKGLEHPSVDDEYGNFEPDPDPKTKRRGRGRRGGNSSNRSRKR